MPALADEQAFTQCGSSAIIGVLVLRTKQVARYSGLVLEWVQVLVQPVER